MSILNRFSFLKNAFNSVLRVFCLFCILSQSVRAEGNFMESDRTFRDNPRRYACQDHRCRQQEDS